MKNLSDIVNVSISIEEPLVDSTSFDHMLIVGPEPEGWSEYSDEELNKKDSLFVCSSAIELTERDSLFAKTDEKFGDPIGIAGRVAFSQDPKPDRVYFAVNKKLPATIKDCEVIVVNSADDLPEALKNTDVKIEGTPWVIGSLVFNDKTEAKKRTTHFVLSKGVGEFDDENTVSVEADGVNYVCVPVGADCEGSYTIRVEDTVYSSEDKSDANIVNKTNCSVSFDIDSEGNLDKNSYSRKYEYSYEPIEDTLNRALLTNGWYVVCPAYTDEDTLERIGSWVDAQTKMCAFPVFDIPANDEETLCAKSLRCFGIFAKQNSEQKLEDVPVDNKYIHVAWAAKCLNFHAGSETWALKTLVGIQPASLSSTMMRKIEDAKLSYYTTCADRDITCGGMTTYGEWIDVIRFRDWLQNDMQKAIFSLLLKNPKVPYTDKGIALVKSEMIASLKRGQQNGGIADTEYDNDDNEIPGFVVTVPKAANIPDSEKKSRKLKDCKFRARLAGAIHVVDIRGTLAYSI